MEAISPEIDRSVIAGRGTGLLDPLSDRRWQLFVDSCGAAQVFHHGEWLRLLRDQYGYRMSAVCVDGGDGEIAAAVPVARIRSALTGSRLVALPFSDVCGPLVRAEATPWATEALCRLLRHTQRHAGIELEVRASVEGLGGVAGPRFYHHTLPLSNDLHEIEARFSKSQVKRGIKKAIRDGVVVERSTDRLALDSFFQLHMRTRRHQGVPTQPRRFIRRFERLFDRGLGFVLTARWNQHPIAAAVFLYYNGTLTYKYGASDRTHLPKRPNNLLFMEAIRWGCENAMHTLDLGRTDLDNEGLRAFKRAWGADERMLTYTRLPARARPSRTSSSGGPVGFVIQRTPPFVGRAVGAALYKHFG